MLKRGFSHSNYVYVVMSESDSNRLFCYQIFLGTFVCMPYLVRRNILTGLSLFTSNEANGVPIKGWN